MNNLIIWKRKIAIVILLFGTIGLVAQSKYKETFKVGDDVLVSVNTSHTNVIFETWNKNVVEIEAFVDDENLTEEEKEEIFKNWDLDVLGNSKKVVVTSNSGSLWGRVESLGNLEQIVELERLNELSNLSSLDALKNLNLDKLELNIVIPDIPEFRACPESPFGDGNTNFDSDLYKKDKQKYVDKLNKKLNKKVTVKQVDKWLQEVDEWSEEFSGVMESWGENFGKEFEDKFGPEFEEKMEKWGEEYEKKMQAWSEKFGEEIEEKTQAIILDVEKLTEKYEKASDKKHQVMTSPHGSKKVILKMNKEDDEFYSKAKKTIIVKMPKGTRTDINVRHGEVKMVDAFNIKANLNYSALLANSIDGGETLINVSYAPVEINHWKQGELLVKFVDNCRINSVTNIDLKSNSSDVSINSINKSAQLRGSFGNLIINAIDHNFTNIDIDLENAEAKINLPNTAFSFDFIGKKTPCIYPATMNFNHSKKDGKVLVNGFNKSNTSDKKISINAVYSNVRMQ